MAKHSNVPGFFMCPRYVVDEVALALTREELLVLLFAMRHILGWDETFESRKAHISLTMFAKGRKTKSGTVMKGTGLGETALRNALASLVELGLINRVGKPTEAGQLWELPVEYDTERMLPRIETRQTANQARIAKARASRGLSDKGGLVQQRALRRTKGGEALSDKGTPPFVEQSTYIDTSNKQEINNLASYDAGLPKISLYRCESRHIAALITAWWNWLPEERRPTLRGRVIPVSHHYANKTHRAYAEVLVERGYGPNDVIEWWQFARHEMAVTGSKAYSKMTTMPFGWCMAQVEGHAALHRAKTFYTREAPRCLPWTAGPQSGNAQIDALNLWSEGRIDEAQSLGWCLDLPGRLFTANEYELLKAGKPLPEELDEDEVAS